LESEALIKPNAYSFILYVLKWLFW